jgi:hypothetical protein
MNGYLIRLFERSVLALMLFAAIGGMGIPKAAKAAAEGRISLLADRLHQVRSSIALYRAEHHGRLPGRNGDGRADERAFLADLTERNEKGQAVYLGQMPANPFLKGQAAFRVTVVDDPAARPSGKEGTGWWYNAATGHFAACDSRYHSAF